MKQRNSSKIVRNTPHTCRIHTAGFCAPNDSFVKWLNSKQPDIFHYQKSTFMNPKKIWANLAVSNLDRTTAFYTRLGFKQNGTPNGELTSFLFSDDAFVIHFFLKHIIEANVKIRIADTQSSNEIIFTLSAETRQQVDEWAKEVEAAGGKIVSEPEAFGANYYGFVFADPDGHRFNVFQM
jgi:uncharacterized protein